MVHLAEIITAAIQQIDDEPRSPFLTFEPTEPGYGVAQALDELGEKTRANPGSAFAGAQSLGASARAWLSHTGPSTLDDIPEVRDRQQALQLLEFWRDKYYAYPATAHLLTVAAGQRLGAWIESWNPAPLGSQHQNAQLLQRIADLEAQAATHGQALRNQDAKVQDAIQKRLVEEHARKVAEAKYKQALEESIQAKDKLAQAEKDLAQARTDLINQQEAAEIDAQLALLDPVRNPHMWRDEPEPAGPTIHLTR